MMADDAGESVGAGDGLARGGFFGNALALSF